MESGLDPADCGERGMTHPIPNSWMPSNIPQKRHQPSSIVAFALLAAVVVFGIFNRITFPAFLIIPGFRLIPHVIKR